MSVLVAVILGLLQEDSPYPLKVGHEWVFEGTGPRGAQGAIKKIVGTENINQKDVYVIEDTGYAGYFAKLYLTSEYEVLKTQTEINKAFVFLKVPFQKEKWGDTVKFGDGDWKLEFETVGEEEVEVPAGKFKAFRVRCRATQDTTVFELSQWFARGVGEVRRDVKVTSEEQPVDEFSLKLKEFKPSKAYTRKGTPCECARVMGKGVCKCNHCSGEKDAQCYCGTGGCKCGETMAQCGCLHCTGYPGGDDGKDGCDCKK